MLTTLISTTSNLWSESAQDIQKVLERDPQASFFLQPVYQSTWWQHLGQGELRHLVVSDNQQHLIGLASFFVTIQNGKKVWRLVGAKDETDYLDILAAPPDRPGVTNAIWAELNRHQSEWDEINLECIRSGSTTLELTRQAATQFGWHISQTQQDVCPVITLPTTWPEYLDTLDASHRKNLTKLLKTIGSEDEIEYELLTDINQAHQAAQDFIMLHQQSGADKKSFWNPTREAFFIDLCVRLLPTGWLKLYFLRVNGERAASLLIFDYQNQFLLYNSGFNAYRYGYLGVGNALILHTIQEAISLGKTRYDFMRGNESYKFQFGAVSEPLYDLRITRD